MYIKGSEGGIAKGKIMGGFVSGSVERIRLKIFFKYLL